MNLFNTLFMPDMQRISRDNQIEVLTTLITDLQEKMRESDKKINDLKKEVGQLQKQQNNILGVDPRIQELKEGWDEFGRSLAEDKRRVAEGKPPLVFAPWWFAENTVKD